MVGEVPILANFDPRLFRPVATKVDSQLEVSSNDDSFETGWKKAKARLIAVMQRPSAQMTEDAATDYYLRQVYKETEESIGGMQFGQASELLDSLAAHDLLLMEFYNSDGSRTELGLAYPEVTDLSWFQYLGHTYSVVEPKLRAFIASDGNTISDSTGNKKRDSGDTVDDIVQHYANLYGRSSIIVIPKAFDFNISGFMTLIKPRKGEPPYWTPDIVRSTYIYLNPLTKED